MADASPGRSAPRRAMRKHYAILAAILVAIVVAIGLTWWKAHQHVSKENATTEAVRFANEAAQATGRAADAPATPASAHVTQCDNGAGGYDGYNAWTSITISNVTRADADKMDDAFGAYLRRNGFTKIQDQKSQNTIRSSGLKGDVLVELIYDPQAADHIARVNATAGCPA